MHDVIEAIGWILGWYIWVWDTCIWFHPFCFGSGQGFKCKNVFPIFLGMLSIVPFVDITFLVICIHLLCLNATNAILFPLTCRSCRVLAGRALMFGSDHGAFIQCVSYLSRIKELAECRECIRMVYLFVSNHQRVWLVHCPRIFAARYIFCLTWLFLLSHHSIPL